MEILTTSKPKLPDLSSTMDTLYHPLSSLFVGLFRRSLDVLSEVSLICRLLVRHMHLCL